MSNRSSFSDFGSINFDLIKQPQPKKE